ncbi:MAG: acyl-CoA reductase, partial [Candidatus Eremiobacterota bacterium]
VVWGGAEAVQAWSRDAGPGTKVVRYGPRLSMALVTFAYLQERGPQEVAHRMAQDVVMWEQRGCGSPQALFVQMPEPGHEEDLIQALVEALADELEALSASLPQGELTLDEQIEILREREVAAFGELVGESFARWPGYRPLRFKKLVRKGSPRAPGTRWTLLWRNRADRLGSPLNRTLVLHPFTRFEEVAEALAPHRSVLQSVGVGARAPELLDLSNLLAPLGVTRFTELGAMHRGKMGSPHDGTFQLPQLLRWSCIESVEERFDVGQRLDPEKPDRFDKTARLLNLLDYARERSPLYAERLKDLELTGPEVLLQVPLLTGEDIRLNTPPVGQALLTGPFEGAYVFASGGSTGAPKFSLYSYEEWEEVTSLLASIYEVAGITPGDTVGNLFMAGNLWTSFLAASQALEKIGGVTLPIAGNADVEQVMRYLELFRPTALLGLPSVLIQIAETVEREGLKLKIPKILYGGEHLYREARDYLRKVLGSTTVLSAGYASVDGGPIGYQCSQRKGSVHHLLYHYQFLELIDPPSGRPVAAGQVGEVVITCLNRRLMPLIRYRTGDLARMVEEECPCGRKTPLFELKGRADDVVRVGTVSLYPDDVAAALDVVEGLSHLFQIVAEREGAKDRLTIRVETLGTAETGLAGLARDALLERSPELSEALSEGWLGSLEVELLATGGLPRVARTGKIRRVVDQRG